jgi:hypothetical protein
MSDDKLFTLNFVERPVQHSGHTADQKQVLITRGLGQVYVAVFFDQAGQMLHYKEYPFDGPDPRTLRGGDSDDAYEAAYNKIFREIGFQYSAIHVKKFFIAKHLLGIKQYTNRMQHFLKEGHEYSKEEIETLKLIKASDAQYKYYVFSEEDLEEAEKDEDEEDRAFFQEWIAKGYFVYWNEYDYWCDLEGNVIAS